MLTLHFIPKASFSVPSSFAAKTSLAHNTPTNRTSRQSVTSRVEFMILSVIIYVSQPDSLEMHDEAQRKPFRRELINNNIAEGVSLGIDDYANHRPFAITSRTENFCFASYFMSETWKINEIGDLKRFFSPRWFFVSFLVCESCESSADASLTLFKTTFALEKKTSHEIST